MDPQDNDDDADIYGDDPTPAPVQPIVNEPIIEQPPIIEVPEVKKEIPKIRALVSGLDWWITDETIRQQLSTIGPVVELELFSVPSNGKFNGVFECWIQTEKSESQVVNLIKQLQFGQTSDITVTPGSSAKSNLAKISTGNDEPALKLPGKPAPMLYDDPRNPIPRNLLPFNDVDSDRPKRSDDKRGSSKKGSDRDRDKHRDRGWRRDRDRRDYDYDYDYTYDDKDYRRRDDRDDYYDRDRRRRDDDREDRHRDKRRK
ncbi:eukaryotic translation initiation factor 3 subunit 10 [Tritrichomonas foetus]|uniref:Eukaryotic translation initiation factor 3 subunit 10 n=1 Tax=Tritrichomonas foetus TaxID=1144522 RepID=A0A1J4K2V1_9EUKA|nr:eukaryotic translation initiation factor 3 subunit 10 [Tritrichomonas foetus]|eukprot:OHT05711.1 eukaryotic translation initiation factor 3 subunit 10 [Tritrichomonas foetus]